jgi:hypothetical protein
MSAVGLVTPALVPGLDHEPGVVLERWFDFWAGQSLDLRKLKEPVPISAMGLDPAPTSYSLSPTVRRAKNVKRGHQICRRESPFKPS